MTASRRVSAIRRGHTDCCLTRRCREGQCSLSLPAETTPLCLSGTAYQANHDYSGRLCDCLIIWPAGGGLDSVAAELKAGRVRTRQALEQLQAGALVMEELLRGVTTVRFRAVLTQRRGSSLDQRLILVTRIAFRKERRIAKVLACGSKAERAFAPDTVAARSSRRRRR
jgi:hypothetical protein